MQAVDVFNGAVLDQAAFDAAALDGVQEQVSTYASLGYDPAHLTTRYVGSAAILSAALAARAMLVGYVAPGDVEGIIDYDALHTPARRNPHSETDVDDICSQNNLFVDPDGFRLQSWRAGWRSGGGYRHAAGRQTHRPRLGQTAIARVVKRPAPPNRMHLAVESPAI